LVVEENSPQSRSFGIDNIQQEQRFHDFTLCYLEFFEPMNYYTGLKKTKMTKPGAAAKRKHAVQMIPQ